MNSGRDPTLLTEQECAFASNVTFRNGYPTNRQKWWPMQLKTGGGSPDGLTQFQTGFIQGATIYDISDTEQHIMCMSSGVLLQIDIGSGMTITSVFNDGKSNPQAPQVWMCQADVYFVIQDGTSTAIIMQGLQLIRRANSAVPEAPVGQSMAYGQGRLWITQGRQVIAGDLLGGPTSVVSFTEQTYLGEAAFFGVPLSCGNVVGLIFVPQGDTNTGQGNLLMFARKAAYSIQAGVPREATQTSSGFPLQPGWQGTPNMQTVALVNIGGTGQRNLLTVNQDIFFRSKDGWRTYRTARNEQYGWGGAPISNEMLRITTYDSLELLDFASSVLFKNRVFLTATPVPYKQYGSAAFHNLIVLDLNVISSVINKSNLAYEFSPYFSQRGSPAYDGVWMPPNGLQVVQLIQGEFDRVERMFGIMYNPATKKNEIWELVDNEAFDNQNIPVQCQIETKSYDFKTPDTLKELRKADIYFTGVDAPILLTVEFRSDGYPTWIPWVVNAKLPGHAQPCHVDTSVCQSPGCPVEGYWMPVKLPTPPNDCDINTGKLIRVGYHFQLRITWVGPATIHMVILHAEELVEDPNGHCPSLLPYNPHLADPVL